LGLAVKIADVDDALCDQPGEVLHEHWFCGKRSGVIAPSQSAPGLSTPTIASSHRPNLKITSGSTIDTTCCGSASTPT